MTKTVVKYANDIACGGRSVSSNVAGVAFELFLFFVRGHVVNNFFTFCSQRSRMNNYLIEYIRHLQNSAHTVTSSAAMQMISLFRTSPSSSTAQRASDSLTNISTLSVSHFYIRSMRCPCGTSPTHLTTLPSRSILRPISSKPHCISE